MKLTYLQLFLGMVIFGSATPVSKIVGSNVSPLMGTLVRLALAALLLLPVIFLQWKDIHKLKGSDFGYLLGISAIGTIGFTAFMLYGMQKIPGVLGSIVMSTTPAVTALASVIFLDEKFTQRRKLAIVFAVGGLTIMNLGQNFRGSGWSSTLVGIGLILLAVCSETTYTLMGKPVMNKLSPLLTVALATWLSLVLALPILFWEPLDQLRQLNTRSYLALGWWAAGTLALGSWLWYSGVNKVEGGVAAGFMAIMPISALILSYVLLDEEFLWLHVVGFLVVFASVILIVIDHHKMSKKEDAASE